MAVFEGNAKRAEQLPSAYDFMEMQKTIVLAQTIPVKQLADHIYNTYMKPKSSDKISLDFSNSNVKTSFSIDVSELERYVSDNDFKILPLGGLIEYFKSRGYECSYNSARALHTVRLLNIEIK